MGMIQRKTSFEALIESFDADAPPGWPLKGKSLRYGKLQCAIEDCCNKDGNMQAQVGSEQAQRSRFFDALAEEVRRVDRCVPWCYSLETPSCKASVEAHGGWL
jgi:hypothetical protein